MYVFVKRAENKVMSFNLTEYDFAAAYLDTAILFFLLTGCKHE